MIRLNLNDEIIRKHIKYIAIESNIYSNMLDLKREKIFTKEYLKIILTKQKHTENFVDRLLDSVDDVSKLEEILNDDHEKFIEFIIKSIEELKNYIQMGAKIDEMSNIFIAKPKHLNDIIKHVKCNFERISNVFMIEKHLNFENKYSKKLIEVIGYNNFSSRDLFSVNNKYEKFLGDITSKSSYEKFFNEISISTQQAQGKVHGVDILIQIRDKIIKKIEDLKNSSITVKDDERDILTQIIETIKHKNLVNLKNNKSIGKGNFIEILKDAVELQAKKLDSINPGYVINIENIKDYDRLFEIKWSAYKYVLELGVEVCPYCNRQFITPLYCDEGQVRADLDHFYPKYIYPYLSMSIHNLVPSCKFCNSSLKNGKDFEYEKNLNPFEYGFSDLYTFSYDVINENGVINKENLKIVMKDNSRDVIEKEIVEKAKNNSNVFQIENIYNFHKQDICDLIKKKVIYTDKHVGALLKDFNDLFESREQLLDFLMGDYSKSSGLSNRILSKLIQDIRKEIDKTNYVISDDELNILTEFIKRK